MNKIYTQEFKNTFGITFKLFLLYLFLTEVFRTIFIVYYYDKIAKAEIPFLDILQVYTSGLGLDISTAAYFVVIPWLLLLINSILKFNFLKIIIQLYTSLLILLSSFLYIAELGVYNEWEEKPTFGILTYLKHPTEALETNPLYYTIILTIILLSMLYILYKLSQNIYKSYELKNKRNLWTSLAFFIIAPVIIFTGVRGGYSSAPIKQSDAYFSHYKILNDISVNTVYSFYASIIQNTAILSGENVYKTAYKQDKKDAILKELMANSDEGLYSKILTTSRPNVVIVILESVAGDFLTTQKYRNLIPNIIELSSDGILFSKAYAAGTLSHEGLPGVYSGQPAIQDVYVTNLPAKFKKLPSINETLQKFNYDSMFLFGGQLRYGNLTSYIYKNNFRIIEEGRDIDFGEKGRMGVPDGPMLQYFIKKTSKLKEPFFSTMFTLSSHSPYDQPMEDTVNWGGNEKPYLNSVVYTDKSIGAFIKEAKKQSWYKNTLFIFSSDHSHSTPYNWSRSNPKWHHIVMFMYGEVIKKEYRGYTMDKVVAQHDIAATLLSQMEIDHKDFLWSRNVFAKDYKDSAYYAVGGGYGLIENNASFAYSVKNSTVLHERGNTQNLKMRGHVYLEKLVQTYLDY